MRYGMSVLTAFANNQTKDTRHNPAKCPGCKKDLEVAISADDIEPEPGMFSVCIVCGTVSQYTEGLQLRQVTKREIKQLPMHFRKKVESLKEAIDFKIKVNRNKN